LSPAALPHVLLLGLIFGSTLLASRFVVDQFAPTTYVWLRLVLSLPLFVALYTAGGRRWPGGRALRASGLLRDGIILGVFGTAVPMVAYVASLQYQSAGMTALLMTTAPALTVLFAQFLLPDERLTARKAVGIAVALGGAALLVLRGESGLAGVSGSPIGYALVIGGMLVDSFMVVYTRRHCRDHDTVALSSVRLTVAALVVAPLSLALIGLDLSAVTPAGYVALVYAAVAGTFGGLMLFLSVNQRYGATAASLTSYILPVVAAAGGVLFLDEQVTPIMLAGMGLIIAGIMVLNQKGEVVLELEE